MLQPRALIGESYTELTLESSLTRGVLWDKKNIRDVLYQVTARVHQTRAQGKIVEDGLVEDEGVTGASKLTLTNFKTCAP